VDRKEAQALKKSCADPNMIVARRVNCSNHSTYVINLRENEIWADHNVKKGCRLFLVAGWGMTSHAWDPLLASLDSRFEAETGNWNDLLSQSSHQDNPHDICLGWSLGGMLLLEAILNGEMEADHLVLVSTSACFTGDGPSPGAHPRILQRMKKKLDDDREEILREFLENSLHPLFDSNSVDHHLKLAERFTSGELARGLDYLLKTRLNDRLKELKTGVTIIHGTEDRIIPPEAGRLMHSEIPNSIHAEAEGAGHALPLTHHELIRDILNDYESRQ
jgi:pimeloyl-[acyl-carrier protein] methyl ester esterase